MRYESTMPILALLVVSTLAFGVWGFLLKKAVVEMPPLAAYVAFAATNVILIPSYFLLARAWETPLKFPGIGIAYSAGASLAVAIGTIALLYAMRTRDAGVAVAFTASYPVITMLLGVVLLSEPITVPRVAGVSAIAIGAVLVTR